MFCSNLTPALHYNFKQCISDSGGSICSVGASIFSGSGSNEFVAVAQANKPSIHMYQWNKPQVQLQCHLQETVSCPRLTHTDISNSLVSILIAICSAALWHLVVYICLQDRRRDVYIAGIQLKAKNFYPLIQTAHNFSFDFGVCVSQESCYVVGRRISRASPA